MEDLGFWEKDSGQLDQLEQPVEQPASENFGEPSEQRPSMPREEAETVQADAV